MSRATRAVVFLFSAATGAACLTGCDTTVINVAHHAAAGDDAGADDMEAEPSDAGPQTKTDAAGSKTTPTTGDQGSAYPAKHAELPIVAYLGGHVLDAPELVTVTFAGDQLRNTAEAFDDFITTSAWWDTVRAGYCDTRPACIGHGTSGGHIHLTTAAAPSYADTIVPGGASDIQNFIATNIKSGKFPAPTAETLYMIYFPASTTVTLDDQTSCDNFGGYHSSMSVTPPGASAPVRFPYAILNRCQGTADELTEVASHELIEAATDPYYARTANGYDAYGSSSFAWDVVSVGGEVGDRCFRADGSSAVRESGYLVTRAFSNKEAQAGHDPCVPVPYDYPFFNLAPAATIEGVGLSLGVTKTFDLVGYSDAPTDAFAIDVQDVTQILGDANPVATLSLDSSTATNGTHVKLRVTLLTRPTQSYALFMLTAKIGGVTNQWPLSFPTN